ncbi:MAG: PEP-CTERM sorting domain-containing protein [Hydrogenophaga sp.]|nr:PEP-CTERM sorting domain-containing protein [Hydrogenophaga sp.]
MKTFAHPLTLATALLVLSPAAPASQGVSLASGLTDFTTWSLFGDASAANDSPGNGFNYSTLRLTAPGAGGQAGAGFAPAALALDFNQAFSFDFNFFIPASQGLRGDGMTFTLAATPGVGSGGSDLGYGGLGSDSLAFAIDTFHFDGEPVSPSVQILQGGNVTPLASTETGLGDTIRDPNYQWRGMLSYLPSGNGDNAGELTGTIWHLNLGSFAVAASVDFNALGLVGVPVFYGFTAGNGLATDGHFVTSAAPVPEPGSLAMMLAGLAGLGWLAARRRPGV